MCQKYTHKILKVICKLKLLLDLKSLSLDSDKGYFLLLFIQMNYISHIIGVYILRVYPHITKAQIFWNLETISTHRSTNLWGWPQTFPSPWKTSLFPIHQPPFLRDKAFLISITIEFFCLCLDDMQIKSYNTLSFVSLSLNMVF